MNSIRSSQKILASLAGLAAFGLAAATGGLLLGFSAMPLFTAASGALILIIAAHDYAPRATYSTHGGAVGASLPAKRRVERMPLAA